ncbi:MAG TPA: DUF4186 domain-containing protein [Candidatus Omnitrophota bacterium]|nr:DUF4186 domain-containing protein [Candidatus Omnitrophota bacterium]
MINDENRASLLASSKFRSRFKLDQKDHDYIKRIGIAKIREHTVDFIEKRLAPAEPPNDGQQTPFKGHPAFKAQHATATCCRGCLLKWYGIAKGRVLTGEEISKVVDIIMQWILEKQGNSKP